jgi:DNA invertase Pin-like site-specific DNA recombinase
MIVNSGRLHGYARVSTDEQDLAMQIEALAKAGVDRDHIYTDKRSGKDMRRGGLQDVLSMMRRGDVLVVWRFDRLSRSLRDLLHVFDDLQERGIQLRSLHEQLDTTTPMGKLMFQLAGMLAEFERALIAQRTAAGMATAKSNGKKFGPPRKLDKVKLTRAIKLLREGKDVKTVARRFGVSVVTLRDRVLEENNGKRLWKAGPRPRTRR